jgi:MFS family permease
VPVALLGGVAGALTDRFGARPTVGVTLATTGVFALFYVFVRNIAALIGLGVIEGALTTGGQPALQAEVSRLAPEGQQGRTQGVYRTAMVLAQMGGSLIAGFLFTLWPGWPFVSMAVICGLSFVVVLVSRMPR